MSSATSTAPLAASEPAPNARVSHTGLVLGVILTCQLMVVLDATIVNVALPQMQRALSFSDARLSWVLNAYTLDLRRSAAARGPSR